MLSNDIVSFEQLGQDPKKITAFFKDAPSTLCIVQAQHGCKGNFQFILHTLNPWKHV